MRREAAELIRRHGRELVAADTSGERSFFGFLEPLGAQSAAGGERSRAGVVSHERFRLVAEPAEEFSQGLSTRVRCGETEYKVLSIREIYAGEELSHRECVLRRVES